MLELLFFSGIQNLEEKQFFLYKTIMDFKIIKNVKLSEKAHARPFIDDNGERDENRNMEILGDE